VADKPKATPRVGGGAASLELELPLAAGLTPAHPLESWFHGPEGMVLLQEQSGAGGFLAGSLGTLSVEEVFAHVLTGIRSGLLAVQHGTVRRTVSFRDGQVVFATSTQRWERLGAVLLRLGLLTQAQLTQALSRVTPSRRIGQVLTSEGLVSEAHLYSAMTYVVREVVLGLFELTEGSFLFLEGPAPPLPGGPAAGARARGAAFRPGLLRRAHGRGPSAGRAAPHVRGRPLRLLYVAG
jgi:hypothetical protein